MVILKEFNLANAAAILIMILYLAAISNIAILQDIVQAIDIVSP